MLWSGRQRFKRERQTALCGSQRQKNTPNSSLCLTGYLMWQWQRQRREKNGLFSHFLFFPPYPFIFSCWALQKTSVNNVCHKKTFDVSQKSKTWKYRICSMHGKLQLFHQFSAWTFVAVILGDSSFAPPAHSTVPAFFTAELENSYSFRLNFFVLHLCLPWIRTKH